MRYVCKPPPGGERNPYQRIDYYDKSPFTNRKLKKNNKTNRLRHNAIESLDYTTIAD